MDEYSTRRIKLASMMPSDSIALLPGAKLQYRNADAEYPFRQNSDFLYLTGFPEPEAFLALCKDGKGTLTYILFNRARDVSAEIWTGKRIGQTGACSKYNADQSYPIAELNAEIDKLFVGKNTLYCPKDMDLSDWPNAPKTTYDLLPLIHEMRLFKSPKEIISMRLAAKISATAHKKMMQACKPNMMEYQLEAVFVSYCLQEGCRALAYNSIVASGDNSCILHYVDNDKKIADGDLVLVDAGGEYEGYAADITRTYPANGKFTAEQKEIYTLVLRAQEAGIEQVKPGNTWDKVQRAMLDVIVPGMIELNLLTGNAEDLIAEEKYKQFYMHSSGHWLGLDVHDAGEYKIDKKWRKFEPGMILTVEPGIYISADSSNVDKKWHGIGIRIEDDILVTDTGYEILSIDAPKQIAEIERATL